jgi:hypothetical protein
MVRDRGPTVSPEDISEGMRVEIEWTSMSGKGGSAEGRVTTVHRGGVANPNGLADFTISTDDGIRYRAYPDRGAYEDGVANPPVERLDDGAVESVGTLTGVYSA